MSKHAITQAIRASFGTEMITNSTCAELAQIILDKMAEELISTGHFNLPGIGSLTVLKRQARTGRNPRSGATIVIPERPSVKFRASSNMLERLGKKPSRTSAAIRVKPALKGIDDMPDVPQVKPQAVGAILNPPMTH